MKTKTETQLELKVAATVAGEDLVCGDYVALLCETYEVPSYFWDCCAVSLAADEPVRLKMIPPNAGEPLRVLALCLPFVYVKTARRKTEILDTRRVQLVRLDRACAKVVCKELRSKSKKKNR